MATLQRKGRGNDVCVVTFTGRLSHCAALRPHQRHGASAGTHCDQRHPSQALPAHVARKTRTRQGSRRRQAAAGTAGTTPATSASK